ncbi:MAG TPA: D-alanyl-D-alanine carboxypeptidase [Xanthobacteraceae bacterium]|jgi:D-alanyl-D-alanine carboxypeptidase
MGLAVTAAALAITSDKADARRHRAYFLRHVARVHRHAGEDYSPPTASILVDANSGAVLEAASADALRHPASLTKVMTLYLLFEQLDAGRLRLDTPLKVSEHAAEQAPTKLDLKPGTTITVEDAIKAIVTRSANDAAVVIADNLAGDEDHFAKLMTQKAHALGMSHTIYVNASGLPDDDQVTTARDQALLGRAIEDRFPRYSKFFATTSFVFHGETIRGHNHLLGSVDGVDGIKTGFTRASGFNLLTSLHRDGRYVVGVVFGGRSAFARDTHMRELIAAHFNEASRRRTAPVVAERSDRDGESQALAFAKALPSRADRTSQATADAIPGSKDPIRPLLVRTIPYRVAPVPSGALAPMPALIPLAAAAPTALPQAGPAPQPAATPMPASQTASAAANATVVTAPATIVDQEIARLDAARPDDTAKREAATDVKAEAATTESALTQPIKPTPAVPAHAHNGWMIQIGAFDSEDEAQQHLQAAQQTVHALATADAFTERIEKGDTALYRARFAGFKKETAAEAACRRLKRNDFACMAVKD